MGIHSQGEKSIGHLLIFNLAVDSKDPVLAFSSNWINALSYHVDKVSVVTMISGNLQVRDNVKVYSIGKERQYSKFRRLLIFYKTLFRLLKNENIEACFSHMMPLFSLMAGPILKFQHIPHVLWYAHGILNWKVKWAEKFVDNIVSSSTSGCRINSPKLRIIGQGIDVANLKITAFGKNLHSYKLLYVGRISRIKNIHILITLLANLQQKYPGKFSLTVAGSPITKQDTVYLKELNQLIFALQLNQCIEFVGHIPHHLISKIYQKSNILLNPSSTGSMDKSVLEAMASGLVVLTCNEAFMNDEFVAAGGIFIHSTDEWLTALEKLIQADQNEWDSRIKKARIWVEREHSLEKLVQKLLALLIPRSINNPLDLHK